MILSRIYFLRLLIIFTILGTPLYLVRFRIFGMPSNVLEVLIVLTIVAVLSDIYYRKDTVVCHDRSRVYNLAHRLSPPILRRFIDVLACGDMLLPAIAFKLITIGLFISLFASTIWISGLSIIKSWFILPFFFALCIVYALVYRIISPLQVFRVLIVGGVFIALASMFSVFFGMMTYDNRLHAFYLSPNHLAMAIVPIVPLVSAGIICALRDYRRRDMVFLSLSFFLLLIILYLTRSFGGMIAAGAGMLLFIVSYYRSWRVFFISTSSIILSFLLVLTALWHTPRVQDFFVLSERSSFASRMMIWRSALDIGMDHPFIGIGAGNFQEVYLAYQRYYPPYLEWAVPQPHNLFFAFWLQSGIIGLCGFLLLFFVLTHRYFTIISQKKSFCREFIIPLAAFSSLFAIIVHGFVDTPYWKNDLSLLFWILVILTAFSHGKLKSAQKKTENTIR